MLHVHPGGGRECRESIKILPSLHRNLPHLPDDSDDIDPSLCSSSTSSANISYKRVKSTRALLFAVIFTVLSCSLNIIAENSPSIPGILCAALAAEEIEAQLPPALVTAETLRANIDEVESATDLTEDQKKELLDLYRKSLSNLQNIKSNLEATEAFRKETQTVSEQIKSIQADIFELEQQQQEPVEGMGEELSGRLDELVQLLQSQQAELAAANATSTDLSRRLNYMNTRPVVISNRLAEAEQEQDEVEAALQASAGEGAVGEARRWVYETGFVALSTEIGMLNEELLSKPYRTSLLEARLKRQAAKVELINQRVATINERLNSERLAEAEMVQREVERVERQARGGNPVLVQLSAENAELTKQINTMAAQLETLARDQELAMKLNARVAANLEDARTTLESSGLTEGLGKVLLAQKKYLPELEEKTDEVRKRDGQIAESEVLRLRLQAEARRMVDMKLFMNQLAEEAREEKSEALFNQIRPQVELRKQLLIKAMDMIELYLEGLNQLNDEERKLVGTVKAYQQFLQQNLLWLRNAEPTKLVDFLDLPREVRELYHIMPFAFWVNVVKVHVFKKPIFWLVLALAFCLVIMRKAIIRAIEEKAKIVGRPTTDSMGNTITVLLLTALLRLPAPLVLVTMGWLLQNSGDNVQVTNLGETFIAIFSYLFFLRFFHGVCMPKGLAEVHFRWPKEKLKFLRIELDRFLIIIIPVGLLVLVSVKLHPENAGGILARLGFLITYLALIIFLYRILHPAKGVLSHLREDEHASGMIMSSYPILFFLLIFFPIALIFLAFSGYLYSVEVVADMFGNTLLLMLGLILLNALLLRWLMVVRRRMNYEALQEKRKARLEELEEAETEGDEEAAMQFEEPEVDVAALASETREFVTLAVFLTGLFGFYMVWSSFLPALKILDEVVLWNNTVTEAGVEKQLPITLADFGLAIIYAMMVTMVARRLPALLEIILLRRTTMTHSDRYTVISLTNYTIITVGVVLVLNTIGAQWSQLQWLIAALGVGIGFGLQEIIANFISGLIILFEQPVRVGDIVTIGDTDGVVTKIRIRATTIRNWDMKELLVPNKEFITGRLLNWSLDDQVTRIYVVIGIAYGSDVDKAMELILQVAEKQEHVLVDPPPRVNFESFGDNSLNLTLRAYIDNIDYRLSTTTEIHREINRLFGEADISIPFPQRDVHLDCRQPLQVKIQENE
ncbi:mechanosensitive ion channel domain-containing protein [Desulfosediminicola sp.]|uniref:mechanosensitive ion channel domain-containing protein n=1 Tax=Desulfosediminicola sp. TaxID=2886825 RepID=UPI003AF2C8A7